MVSPTKSGGSHAYSSPDRPLAKTFAHKQKIQEVFEEQSFGAQVLEEQQDQTPGAPLTNVSSVQVSQGIQKTDAVGKKTLGVKPEYQDWRKEEAENLPKTKKMIAKMLWGDHEDCQAPPEIVDKLREFFVKKQKGDQFNKAIKSDFNAFLALFDDLSVDDMWFVRTSLNCSPLGTVKTEPYAITPADLANLQHYLDDIGFSGSVTLSDRAGPKGTVRTFTVTPTKQPDLENSAFSINSISKIFTGAMALMTFSPEELSDKMHLPNEVLALLGELELDQILSHLEKPSLLQAMQHEGGFGDFLFAYQRAVENAIKNKQPLPTIARPEDFLKFADPKTYPLGAQRYSNLGSLLVGLAIQHKCKDKPFGELLQELILGPAHMAVSTTKPKKGKSAEGDPAQGMIVGGPAGGHWTTSKELAKLGPWFQDQCKPSEGGQKSEFMIKMERFGLEFYRPEDQEAVHNGCSPTGSSHFSTFLQSGVTVSVLSDQGDFMADRIYYMVRQKMVEEQ